MTISELAIAHYKEYLKGDVSSKSKSHTKLSIEFAINVLEECVGTKDIDYMESLAINDTVSNSIYNKIQELKTYLNK